MKISVEKILLAIRNHIQKHIPPMLENAELSVFSEYDFNFPTDSDASFFCVRYAEHKITDTLSFSFIIHIQVISIDEQILYKYLDVIGNYLDDVFDPQDYGYCTCDYTVMLTDTFNKASASLFFDITISTPLTDGDF